MTMMHRPFARATSQPDDVFTYVDYLYELCASGYSSKPNPVSEQQWEMICDMQGKRRLQYVSNSKLILERQERNV